MCQNSATLGDATVCVEDLQHVEPGGWLNDRIISVWCEATRRRHIGGGRDGGGDESGLSIILPNVTYFMLCIKDDDELRQIIQSQRLHQKQLIIAVVNDSAHIPVDYNQSQPSGSHWSALLIDRPHSTFFHLDSLPAAPNVHVARELASRLAPLLGMAGGVVEAVRVPTQSNASDCGK